ncbi:MAG: ADP-glyceromanno-heptose 6-epimerase [Gemmatimonadales bacterium]|nr:MAG: ADP-glyceromanno-heptose 6-epimerase [Gemmatimonadales bacterium]
MIVVTGGAGFIGSCLAARLNGYGRDDLIIVDELDTSDKWRNLRALRFAEYVDKADLFEFLDSGIKPDAILHMGACSSTMERDADCLYTNNFRYTETLARWCLKHETRFVYASSAATYGDGSQGHDDSADLSTLRPLNMYAYSKHLFDVQAQKRGWAQFIAGVKFFNVYGPNEHHKADMRSVVFKAFEQINESGTVKLFRSHRSDYEDGGQMRDFVYVKDAVDMVLYLADHPEANGLFNSGTGTARSFSDLAKAVFTAMDREPSITYIDMPVQLRDRYQYYTQATTDRIRGAGYDAPFNSLEDGIADYVQNYLVPARYMGE